MMLPLLIITLMGLDGGAALLCGYSSASTSPTLPTGFHGVVATASEPGNAVTYGCGLMTNGSYGIIRATFGSGGALAAISHLPLLYGCWHLSVMSIEATTKSASLLIAGGSGTITRFRAETGRDEFVAGAFEAYGTSDGVGATARFGNWVFLASIGNPGSSDPTVVYAADSANHCIRAINPSTGAVTTVAGRCGVVGNVAGAGDVARFNSPQHLHFDSPSARLVVVDIGNVQLRRVQLSTSAPTAVAASTASTAVLTAATLFPLKFAYAQSSDSLLVGANGEGCATYSINTDTGEIVQEGTAADSSCSGVLVGFGVSAAGSQYGMTSTDRPIVRFDLCPTTRPTPAPIGSPATPSPTAATTTDEDGGDSSGTMVFVVIGIVAAVVVIVGVVAGLAVASTRSSGDDDGNDAESSETSTAGRATPDLATAMKGSPSANAASPRPVTGGAGGTAAAKAPASKPTTPQTSAAPRPVPKSAGSAPQKATPSAAAPAKAARYIVPEAPPDAGAASAVAAANVDQVEVVVPSPSGFAGDGNGNGGDPLSALAQSRDAHGLPVNKKARGFLFPTIEDSFDNEAEHARRRKLVEDGRYKVLQRVARTAHCSTFACMLEDGSFVALKETELCADEESAAEEMRREVERAKNWLHPNVMKYYGFKFLQDEMKVQVFIELAANGTLQSFVAGNAEPLPEKVIRRYVRQIVAGLAFLHANGVVHRDLNPSTVCLTQEGICKVSDFSACTIVGTTTGKASRRAHTIIGVATHMAPEIFLSAMNEESDEAGYGTKADVWSLGITTLQMLNCGEPPWPKFPNEIAAFRHIAQEGVLPNFPTNVSAECDDFVRRCCTRDPHLRPKAAALMDHPWLRFDII